MAQSGNALLWRFLSGFFVRRASFIYRSGGAAAVWCVKETADAQPYISSTSSHSLFGVASVQSHGSCAYQPLAGRWALVSTLTVRFDSPAALSFFSAVMFEATYP
jgi:hypothetical protein